MQGPSDGRVELRRNQDTLSATYLSMYASLCALLLVSAFVILYILIAATDDDDDDDD